MLSVHHTLRLLGAVSCFSLVSCGTLLAPKEDQRKGNADRKPGQSRYLPPQNPTNPSPPVGSTTTIPGDEPVGTTTTTTTTTTDSGAGLASTPSDTATPPAPTPPTPSQPSYGKLVPGRPGFVYPPGAEARPENMVDVRDYTPGQKVRDPRTQKVFLVP